MMEQFTIKEISKTIKTGKTPPTKEDKYFNGELDWYTPGDLKLNKFLKRSQRTLTNLAITDKKATIHEPGTLLIGCIGDIGKLGITTTRSSSNQQLTGIYPNENTDVNYLYYWFRGHKKVLENYSNNAVVPILNNRTLEAIKIPLPPLPTQKKIAALLDAADAYRQKTKVLIEKYDELTQSLFLDMFGDPVVNTKEWNETIFTDVLILRRGFDLPKKDRISGDFPIMASNGILDWHNEFKVKGPGVVTGRSGTLGQVHYIESNYWPLNTSLYSVDLKGNNPIYLLFLLRNFRVERFTRGAGVPTLNRNLVHAETIMTVPLELQNQFAERVQKIEAQKAQAQESLIKAEELFNSLLGRAFKGELTI